MSDATIMQGELLSLLQGKIPKTRMWQREMFFGTGTGPASANKWVNNNACEALFSLIKGDRARAAMIVTHMGNWIADNPFMATEWTTPEEVYRTLPLNGHATLAGIAEEMGSPHYQSILAEARGSVIHLAKAVGGGPGKKVIDHQLNKVGKNVILIGTGGNSSPNQYATQVGHRGWVRSREKKQPPVFLFADRTGLSQILALAAGLNPKRKHGASEYDFYYALQRRFPRVPVYGFDFTVQAIVRSLMANPTDPSFVIELVSRIGNQRSGPRQIVTRFADGSVAILLCSSINSSTDACCFDMWYPGGKTVKGSAGTGAREGSGEDNVKPLRGWEDATHWYWQDADGGDAVQSWEKPNVPVAYVIDDDPLNESIIVRDGQGNVLYPTGDASRAPENRPPLDFKAPRVKPRPWWRFWS